MIQFCDQISTGLRDTISTRLQKWLPDSGVTGATVRTLSGGAINRNYFVEFGAGYVLRLAPSVQTRSRIGIDMANSAVVARLAAEAGVGPSVIGVDRETGDSLIEFLPGVLNTSTIRNSEVLQQIGHAVRTLHELPSDTVRNASAFDELDQWFGKAVDRGARYPDNQPHLWRYLEDCRSVLENVEGRCVSHRDLNPQNCIRTNNGVKLIDWDFSGVDSPYLDLAMLTTYAELDDSQLNVLLQAAMPDFRPEDLARVQLTRFVHALREWAWCLNAGDSLIDSTYSVPALLPTQASSELNFYDGYREVNWRFAEHLINDLRWQDWMRSAASPLPAPGFR